jgi:GNAT superfamily N-acetyltransferase
MQLDEAFEIVGSLRAHLDLGAFRDRAARQMSVGYRMAGAYEGDSLLGVIGYRFVETLARGRHVHVDDLVAHPAHQRCGIGTALMDYVENLARVEGGASVFLDSRPDALEFYEKRGYVAHPAPLLRKKL